MSTHELEDSICRICWGVVIGCTALVALWVFTGG
jgi:hypothetical protein